MQREVHQLDLDREVPFQLFNTPGAEKTPRSDIIAEEFERDRLGHRGTPSVDAAIAGCTVRVTGQHATGRGDPQPGVGPGIGG